MTDTVDFSTALWDNPTNSGTQEDWSGEYSATSSNTDSGTIYVTVTDLLGNAASQTFDYIRDTEPPSVDVTCPASTAVPSWSVSWSGSDSPPASGLKHFDVQYEVESGGWTDWRTDTLLTQDTFGPNSPTLVQDNTTYCFKVRAEDNVSNESLYTDGEDCTTYSSGIKRVFLPLIMAPDPNWGFETGDFTNWQHGGVLHTAVTPDEPHSGSYSALLGDPGWDCDGGVPKNGSAWMRRIVTVPSSGSPTLTFWYKLYTQDKNTIPISEVYDFFAVYVNGNLVWKDANTTDNYGCSTLNELEDTPIISLSGYQGQIQIAFYVYNRPDDWYNTYVYIDDVSVQ
jgi:hypothetical protein